jgi:hypothetical protein
LKFHFPSTPTLSPNPCQKSIRSKLVEQYPALEPHLDQILPKKENFRLVKCREHLELIADPAGAVQFFKVSALEWAPKKIESKLASLLL